jgi:hypothetical protein
MRWISGVLIVAMTVSELPAQSLISRDSVTPKWAQLHLIGGIDAPAPGFGKTFACVKSWPEVTRALIAVYKQSGSNSLSRANAILVLGATGLDSAFRFLVSKLDHVTVKDPIRRDIVLALGNSADPPDYVYDRLELALASGFSADGSFAARALSDIRSPKAEAILRKVRVGETNPQMTVQIDGALKRIQNGHGRTVTSCDSTTLAHDRE